MGTSFEDALRGLASLDSRNCNSQNRPDDNGNTSTPINKAKRKRGVQSQGIFGAGPSTPKIAKTQKARPFYRDCLVFKHRHMRFKRFSDINLNEWGKRGYFKDAVKLDRNSSSTDIKEQLYNLFGKRLPRLDNFKFLCVTEDKKFREFYTEEAAPIDGEFLYQKSKKIIIILPDTDVIDYDALEEEEDDIGHPATSSATSGEERVIERNGVAIFIDREGNETPLVDAPLPKTPSIIEKFLEECRGLVNGASLDVIIRRGDPILPQLFEILEHRNFDMTNGLFVRYEGEPATGTGPKKEVFTTALRAIRDSNLLEGNEYEKSLKKNIQAVQDRTFYHMGTICALSILHGGPAPNFFSRCIYGLIMNRTGDVIETLSVSDVMNTQVRMQLLPVLEAETLEGCNNAMADANMLFALAGTDERLTAGDGDGEENWKAQRHTAVKGVLKFYSVDRIEKEVKAFAEGFNRQIQLLDQIKQLDPVKVFIHSKGPLTAQDLLQACSINEAEAMAFQFFKKYLEQAENGSGRYTVSSILQFFTGLDDIPPFGFKEQPKIVVNATGDIVGRDCFNTLELPGSLTEDYDVFEMAFNIALSERTFTMA